MKQFPFHLPTIFNDTLNKVEEKKVSSPWAAPIYDFNCHLPATVETTGMNCQFINCCRCGPSIRQSKVKACFTTSAKKSKPEKKCYLCNQGKNLHNSTFNIMGHAFFSPPKFQKSKQKEM